MNIISALLSENSLDIVFENGFKDYFPYIGHRDHCKDSKNWDSRSNQRTVFTALLDPKIKISEFKFINDNKKIEVKWPDMEEAVSYSADFLYENRLDTQSLKNSDFVWDKDMLHETFITINYEKILKKEGMKTLLKTISCYGFSIIENCPKNMTSVEYIANEIGYVRNSIFGGLWSFESNSGMADSAYTQEELRPHTDGTYNHDAPGLQILLCCDYDAEGGESIMVDGFKIAEIIKKTESSYFNVLTKVDVPGRYLGDGVELIAKRPVFKLDKGDKLIQVSFNNYDRSDFRLPNNQIKAFYDSIRAFDKLANEKSMQWRKILKPGQMLIFNNWRILHGRSEFKGKRKMAGCYINKEDFESSCRMFGLN